MNLDKVVEYKVPLTVALVLVVLFSLVSGFAGFKAGQTQEANYSVETVALCENVDLENSEYDWKCQDRVILHVNGDSFPVYTMPEPKVYRKKPVNLNMSVRYLD